MSFVAAKIQQNCTGTGNYNSKATRQGIICAHDQTLSLIWLFHFELKIVLKVVEGFFSKSNFTQFLGWFLPENHHSLSSFNFPQLCPNQKLHKVFAKSSPTICPIYCQSYNWWRFHKILWPSQKIWTLLQHLNVLCSKIMPNFCRFVSLSVFKRKNNDTLPQK